MYYSFNVYLLTYLQTGDGQEATLVRRGRELSMTTLNSRTLVYTRPPTSTMSSIMAKDRGSSVPSNDSYYYWATVCKTVRPMLSDRCPLCLSVCNVGVLRPNGWMDQDETRYGGRPRPRPHTLLDGDPAPLPKGAQPPNFRPCLLL